MTPRCSPALLSGGGVPAADASCAAAHCDQLPLRPAVRGCASRHGRGHTPRLQIQISASQALPAVEVSKKTPSRKGSVGPVIEQQVSRKSLRSPKTEALLCLRVTREPLKARRLKALCFFTQAPSAGRRGAGGHAPWPRRAAARQAQYSVVPPVLLQPPPPRWRLPRQAWPRPAMHAGAQSLRRRQVSAGRREGQPAARAGCGGCSLQPPPGPQRGASAAGPSGQGALARSQAAAAGAPVSWRRTRPSAPERANRARDGLKTATAVGTRD